MQLQVIAHAHNGFSQKFGIPRQSREDSVIETRIVFTPDYRVREALRGIEEFSHLWLLWGFHEAVRRVGDESDISCSDWSPTVRPPRLGGNTRMGVFATRSPFRPNNLGLSSVKLLGVEHTKEYGTVLHVAGADLMDGTPIYDIKPYIKYADSHPEAVCGYVDELPERYLNVELPDELAALLPDPQALVDVLSLDPRPSYHDDPEREYGMTFSGFNVKFKVVNEPEGPVVHVLDIK